MWQPSIIVGHENPMNALGGNAYSAGWRRLGEQIPRPKAIISVSAHWFIGGTRVTNNQYPETIHDFSGFPDELYQVQYPAPGDPDLAGRLRSLLAPLPVTFDETWGFDHGTWSVLRHMYRDADIPVVQLSIDTRKPASFHFELGKRLAPLRSEGILIMGSGNLAHNLQLYSWGQSKAEPCDWAVRFEGKVKALFSSGEFEPLVHFEELGPDARLSIPTPDHYLPLLYVLGTWQQGEPISFPVQGIEGGSVSMLSVCWMICIRPAHPLPIIYIVSIIVTVMAINTQFSIAVHIMAGLAYRRDEDTTSTTLAMSVNTSPSFVRRVLARLSKAGLVRTITGKAGACWLAKDPKNISLLDIYEAVDAPKAFSIHSYTEQKSCPVSCNIKGALEKALDRTQRAMEKSLDEITLAEIVSNIRKK